MNFLNNLGDAESKQKIAFLVGGILAFLLLDWSYFYGPRNEALDVTKREIVSLQAELDAKQSKSDARQHFERDLELLAGRVREAEARLPDEREIANLLSNIASSARAVGLDLTLFRNRQETYADFYANVPVEMHMRGTYHELAQFLDRVKRLDRIVNVSDIAIRKPEVRGEVVLVDAACTATTFRFLDEAERARIKEQQQKKKGKRA